jgi:hypothetical protein
LHYADEQALVFPAVDPQPDSPPRPAVQSTRAVSHS